MLKALGVTKTFGEAKAGSAENFVALDDVTLEIPKGKAYGLLGSNGAGKSTLLRLFSGVYLADKGVVSADDQVVFDNPAAKERIMFINDETVQWNKHTLSDMRDFFRLFYPKFSDGKFQELWQVLKLPMNKKLSGFSKGMRRQAAVICGLACQPEYLLLDEAFDGLDPTMRIIVKKMLVDSMLDANMTAVISSHNLKEIDEFCDKAGLIHKGKIVFDRDLDSIKGNVVKVQTAFDTDVSKSDFSGFDLLHFEKTGSVIYLIARGSVEHIKAAIREKNPKILDVVPLSLEEVFIYEMEVLGYDYGGIDGLDAKTAGKGKE